MRRIASYQPSFSSFFPSLLRGHGSRHPQPKKDKTGRVVRRGTPCVSPGCNGTKCRDKRANINAWKEERGI